MTCLAASAITTLLPWVPSETLPHLQVAVKWLSRPQGEPSGVCTGQRKPQDSGSSLRTVVVRSSAKYAPRWMDRKWEM